MRPVCAWRSMHARSGSGTWQLRGLQYTAPAWWPGRSSRCGRIGPTTLTLCGTLDGLTQHALMSIVHRVVCAIRQAEPCPPWCAACQRCVCTGRAARRHTCPKTMVQGRSQCSSQPPRRAGRTMCIVVHSRALVGCNGRVPDGAPGQMGLGIHPGACFSHRWCVRVS